MKRIAAIFLLSIQLFNLGGYLGLRQYLVYRSDCFLNKLAAQNRYLNDDLVEIEVPIALPVASDDAGYTPISGQIQFANNAYNYVQIKITKQSVFLKCLPNYKATRLNANNIIWATGIKSKPIPQKQHVPNVGVLFLDAFNIGLPYTSFKAPSFDLYTETTAYQPQLVNHYIDIPTQPPKEV